MKRALTIIPPLSLAIALCVAALSAALPPSAQAQERKQLNIFIWSEYIDP
ncbi:MAG: hypothetical protein LBG06_08275 [Deltaproteobacteria bacterium]|jgi:spermidine/putrescine-binding protein|nr:hypothetical protein [Deltaproteobacteria bacterium]